MQVKSGEFSGFEANAPNPLTKISMRNARNIRCPLSTVSGDDSREFQ